MWWFPSCRPLQKADGFPLFLFLVLLNRHLLLSVWCLFQPASCSRLLLLCCQEQCICFPSFSENCTDFGSTAPKQSSVTLTIQYKECCSCIINTGHVLWIKDFSTGHRAFHKREINCSTLKVKAEYPILLLQRKSNQEEMQACLK